MKNKNKTVRTSRPTGEMINSFKEITNFVHKSQSEKNKNINNILNRKQKIKMPLKMYMGIKKAVLKKHEKEKSHNQIVSENIFYKLRFQNAIIGETHKKEKLMTHVILNKLEEKNDLKKSNSYQKENNFLQTLE